VKEVKPKAAESHECRWALNQIVFSLCYEVHIWRRLGGSTDLGHVASKSLVPGPMPA
jgi:hypothetical protein